MTVALAFRCLLSLESPFSDPSVTSWTSIISLLVFIFHIIPSKLKTSEDLNIWKVSLSFPAKIKIEVSLCSQGKKKKLCIWYLEPSQKTGSYKISLCRGHTNKSQLGLQEIQGQTPASSLLMKRQLLPAAACQRCGADSFPSLYVLKEMLPEQERYTVPKYFFHKTFSSLTSA